MNNNGSNVNNIESYKATILIDLQDEFVTDSTCDTCQVVETTKCMTYCCQLSMCIECLKIYFICCDYKIICYKCKKILSPEDVFKTRQFIESLNQLHEKMYLLRHIDFQICICGTYRFNSTMDAKQKCDKCERWFCFFCNNDWNENNMKNEKYTCKLNCTWETKITYQLENFTYDQQIKIPSHRCCPKCLKCGGYDQKCKYHFCDCKYEFCFICLKSSDDSIRDNQSAYNKPCGDIAIQEFTIFPRIPPEEIERLV